MVWLPPGVKESYGVKCMSCCSYKKIIHGEKEWYLNPLEALTRKLFPPHCPNCGGKLIKDDTIIIRH